MQKYILLSVLMHAAVSVTMAAPQDSLQQLGNIVQVTQALVQSNSSNQGNPSSGISNQGQQAYQVLNDAALYNIPASQISCSSGTCVFKSFNLNQSVVSQSYNVTKEPYYEAGNNEQSMPIKVPLSFINIGLHDGQGDGYLTITFLQDDLTAVWNALDTLNAFINESLYLGFDIKPLGSGKNSIMVKIMDSDSTLYAVAQVEVQGLPKYANIGFNMHDTKHAPGQSQGFINDFDITKGQVISIEAAMFDPQ